jgi:hypothetical protein
VGTAAVKDAADGTWAAMRGSALHGGVSGREGEDGPVQAGPCNGAEQLSGIAVGGMQEGRHAEAHCLQFQCGLSWSSGG